MKPGSRDPKVTILINGEELAELKCLTWMMAEAFGLDRRIERYQGKKPIVFYRWDLDCLIDVLDLALAEAKGCPPKDTPGHDALKNLHGRLRSKYKRVFE